MTNQTTKHIPGTGLTVARMEVGPLARSSDYDDDSGDNDHEGDDCDDESSVR